MDVGRLSSRWCHGGSLYGKRSVRSAAVPCGAGKWANCPGGRVCRHGPLAQLVAHLHDAQGVRGSSPLRPTSSEAVFRSSGAPENRPGEQLGEQILSEAAQLRAHTARRPSGAGSGAPAARLLLDLCRCLQSPREPDARLSFNADSGGLRFGAMAASDWVPLWIQLAVAVGTLGLAGGTVYLGVKSRVMKPLRH